MGDAVRIKPGSKVKLDRIDTNADGGLTKEQAAEKLTKLGLEMDELLDLLCAAGRNGLLIVFQALDTGGKDGSIGHLLNHCNALNTRVVGFKVPTEEEREHDFLWRIHQATPGLGHMNIFNRSHYEDVIVVRVHDLVPEKVWRSRYEHIRAFERVLADSGTIILKFYLHISKKEQEERLLAREEDAVKSWKLSVGDWKEREHWNDYRKAYEDAIEETSTEDAPWWVIPADRKWYRNLVLTEVIVDTLRNYEKGWKKYLEEVGRVAKKELLAYRGQAADAKKGKAAK